MVQALHNTSQQSIVHESKEQVSQSVIFQGVCLVFPALSDLFWSCLPTQTCTTTSSRIYFEALHNEERKYKRLVLAVLLK